MGVRRLLKSFMFLIVKGFKVSRDRKCLFLFLFIGCILVLLIVEFFFKLLFVLFGLFLVLMDKRLEEIFLKYVK